MSYFRDQKSTSSYHHSFWHRPAKRNREKRMSRKRYTSSILNGLYRSLVRLAG